MANASLEILRGKKEDERNQKVDYLDIQIHQKSS